MTQRFDLHMHTLNSDGEYSTKELVEKVKNSGLESFSITDHDDVKSIKEVKSLDLGELEYIPGIEITSLMDLKYTLHILGYGINPDNVELNKALDDIKRKRVIRIYEIVDIIHSKYGIVLPKEEIDTLVRVKNVPSRAHIAMLLVKYGYANNVGESFRLYLRNLNTDTVSKILVDNSIKLIHDAGGYAIWAHPKKNEKDYKMNFKEYMPQLLEMGLDGLEAFNSLHSLDDSNRFFSYAYHRDLMITGGSDYHGEHIKPNVQLGMLFNSGEEVEIPKDSIKILKKCK